MLGSSTHAFKVNFCKYTNETRLALEDASAHSGLKVAGRGERRPARAAATSWRWPATRSCSSTTPPPRSACPRCRCSACCPGTGGLTRVVDKRKVRRDLADVFSSLGEGVKGKRAVQWRLVDETVPLSKFPARVAERAQGPGRGARRRRRGPASTLEPLGGTLSRRRRRASLRHARRSTPASARRPAHRARRRRRTSRRRRPACASAAATLWALRAFRELDDVLLDLRFNRPEIGVVVLQTRGDAARVLAADARAGRGQGRLVRERGPPPHEARAQAPRPHRAQRSWP